MTQWSRELLLESLTLKDIQDNPSTTEQVLYSIENGGINAIYERVNHFRKKRFDRRLNYSDVQLLEKNLTRTYMVDKSSINGSRDSYLATNWLLNVPVFVRHLGNNRDEDAKREIKLHLFSKGHSNIVIFFESFKFKKSTILVFENMDSGSLFDFIYDMKPAVKFKEKAIVYVLQNVLKALSFMHSFHNLHGEIKSSKVLFNCAGDVKLGDFRLISTRGKPKRGCGLFAPYWMPPEFIGGHKFSLNADCWMTGILLIEMTNRSPPFMGETAIRTLYLIKTRPCTELSNDRVWSNNLRHFVRTLLEKDPSKRPSTGELLLHPVFGKDCLCTQKKFADMLRQLRALRSVGKV